jgi:hypothetical protein
MADEYEMVGSDFNNQMLVELCKNHGFTFVTNDGDAKGSAFSFQRLGTAWRPDFGRA